MQVLHPICAFVLENLPDAQTMHVAPVDGWYFPTGQGVQAEEPALL
jgi:hypothetical protein